MQENTLILFWWKTWRVQIIIKNLTQTADLHLWPQNTGFIYIISFNVSAPWLIGVTWWGLSSHKSSFGRLLHQFVIIVQFVSNFIINLKRDDDRVSLVQTEWGTAARQVVGSAPQDHLVLIMFPHGAITSFSKCKQEVMQWDVTGSKDDSRYCWSASHSESAAADRSMCTAARLKTTSLTEASETHAHTQNYSLTACINILFFLCGHLLLFFLCFILLVLELNIFEIIFLFYVSLRYAAAYLGQEFFNLKR